MAQEEEEEIVASGEALRTVAGWLGLGADDVDGVMEKEGLNPEFEAGRTQGLGLGAKFLPHHKAVALVSGVEQRLSSKLKRSAQQGSHGALRGRHAPLAAAGQHGRAHHQHAQHARRGQEGATAPGTGQAQAEDEDDDDSEDEGRGSAFGKGKGGRGGGNKPAAFSRTQLLQGSGGAEVGKKRKRKGGGGGSASGGT